MGKKQPYKRSCAQILRLARQHITNRSHHSTRPVAGVLPNSPLKAVAEPGAKRKRLQTQFFSPSLYSSKHTNSQSQFHKYRSNITPPSQELLNKIEDTWYSVAKYMQARAAHKTGRDADEKLAYELGFSSGSYL
jgi:hypothetical protein